MSLIRKILSNTAWQVVGKVVTAVLGIVSIKFITNYLSRSTYAEYTTIYDYTALFAIVADFGLFTIAVREMTHAKSKEVIEKIVGNVLSIRTLLAVTSLGIGTLIAYLIPVYRDTHVPYGVFIVSIATIITLLAGTMSSVLQFHLRMLWASVALSIGKLITVGYILFTILYLFPNDPQRGFKHLLLAWIIGGFMTILITYIASMRFVTVRFQLDKVFCREVFVKALPYGLALVLGTIYFRMGTIVLSLFNLKTDLGAYGVALRFLEILQIIPHYFMNSVLPTLTARLYSRVEDGARVVRYSLNALMALALPILVGGIVLSWPLTAAVSSSEFLTRRLPTGDLLFGADVALKILLVAMAFTYLHVVLSYTLVAFGKQMDILKANILVVSVNVVLNILLVPRFGLVGATSTAVVSEILVIAVLSLQIHKHFRAIWDFPFMVKTVFSSLVMGVVIFSVSDYFNTLLFSKSLFVLVPIGAVVFMASMFLTRAVSKDMLTLLKKSEAIEIVGQ